MPRRLHFRPKDKGFAFSSKMGTFGLSHFLPKSKAIGLPFSSKTGILEHVTFGSRVSL